MRPLDFLTALRRGDKEEARQTLTFGRDNGWNKTTLAAMVHYLSRCDHGNNDWRDQYWKDMVGGGRQPPPLVVLHGVVSGNEEAAQLKVWTLPPQQQAERVVVLHPGMLAFSEPESTGTAYGVIQESLSAAGHWASERLGIDNDCYVKIEAATLPYGPSFGAAFAALLMMVRFPILRDLSTLITATGEVASDHQLSNVTDNGDKLNQAKSIADPSGAYFVPQDMGYRTDIPWIHRVTSLDELLEKLFVIRMTKPFTRAQLAQLRADRHSAALKVLPAFEHVFKLRSKCAAYGYGLAASVVALFGAVAALAYGSRSYPAVTLDMPQTASTIRPASSDDVGAVAMRSLGPEKPANTADLPSAAVPKQTQVMKPMADLVEGMRISPSTEDAKSTAADRGPK